MSDLKLCNTDSIDSFRWLTLSLKQSNWVALFLLDWRATDASKHYNSARTTSTTPKTNPNVCMQHLKRQRTIITTTLKGTTLTPQQRYLQVQPQLWTITTTAYLASGRFLVVGL